MKKLMDENDGLDGLSAKFISEHSANRKNFSLEIISDKAMEWDEVLLALAAWLKDEAERLTRFEN